MVLRFDYDRALVAAVKSLPRRRFDASTKEWVVPLHLYLDVLSVIEAAGGIVEMDEGLRELLERGDVISPRKSEVTISRCGSEYVVQFEYEPSLVRVAKAIPGRTFDPVSRAWFIPIEDEERTLRYLLDAFESAGCTIRLEPKLKPMAAI